MFILLDIQSLRAATEMSIINIDGMVNILWSYCIDCMNFLLTKHVDGRQL